MSVPATAPDAPAPDQEWRRLSPRMLLVHPVHEALRLLPVLLASAVFGASTGSNVPTLVALAATVAVGVARWFTTTYRLGADTVSLRSGVLSRRTVSVPRSRIRSVTLDARPLHRLLRLTVLSVSTGQSGDRLVLDAVDRAAVPRLRGLLLDGSGVALEPAAAPPWAQWRLGWLRYSPLTLSGLAAPLAAATVVVQTGLVERWIGPGASTVTRSGVVAVLATTFGGLLLAATALSLGLTQLRWGGLSLRRDDGSAAGRLVLRHGLARVREHVYDMGRLRGATLREPLGTRLLGGARLDAVMTGVAGEGEESTLLPPCPRGTAVDVLRRLVDDAADVRLRGHGRAAARRRVTRALAGPALAGVVLVAVALHRGLPGWVWSVWGAAVVASLILAADRIRALGHHVDACWVVFRQGSVARRRDCLAAEGVIGWTVRQTPLQRRAGLATLVAATAAGRKGYPLLDVPVDMAWGIAATASPWVAPTPLTTPPPPRRPCQPLRP